MPGAEALAHRALFGQGQQASGGDDSVSTHYDRAVVQRRVGIEDGLEHLGRDLAVDSNPRGRVVLDPHLTLEGDKRTRVLHAQSLGGSDRLGNRLVVLAGVESRQRAPDVTDAPQLVESASQL